MSFRNQLQIQTNSHLHTLTLLIFSAIRYEILVLKIKTTRQLFKQTVEQKYQIKQNRKILHEVRFLFVFHFHVLDASCCFCCLPIFLYFHTFLLFCLVAFVVFVLFCLKFSFLLWLSFKTLQFCRHTEMWRKISKQLQVANKAKEKSQENPH